MTISRWRPADTRTCGLSAHPVVCLSLESFVDVRGAADVVPRRIAVASWYVGREAADLDEARLKGERSLGGRDSNSEQGQFLTW
jgi:hypothetical protein